MVCAGVLRRLKIRTLTQLITNIYFIMQAINTRGEWSGTAILITTGQGKLICMSISLPAQEMAVLSLHWDNYLV
jgi:hypothetical protein